MLGYDVDGVSGLMQALEEFCEGFVAVSTKHVFGYFCDLIREELGFVDEDRVVFEV